MIEFFYNAHKKVFYYRYAGSSMIQQVSISELLVLLSDIEDGNIKFTKKSIILKEPKKLKGKLKWN